jgi:serine/threonine-protein kinase RIO1
MPGKLVKMNHYNNIFQLLSTGQFSQVYRAEIDDTTVAIRIYDLAEPDSLINEQVFLS